MLRKYSPCLNLLMMVIVGGYETFVSRLRLHNHPDQPEWLSHVNASVLKVKLAMAIHAEAREALEQLPSSPDVSVHYGNPTKQGHFPVRMDWALMMSKSAEEPSANWEICGDFS